MCLPFSIADMVTRVPYSTFPVTSQSASIPPACGQGVRVLRDGRDALGNRALDPSRVVDLGQFGDAQFFIGTARVREMAVSDGHQVHTRRRVDDGIGQAPAHEARADHPDLDRVPVALTLLKNTVDDDHSCCSSRSGQDASCGRDDRDGKRPVQAQGRIVVTQAARLLRSVAVADEIEHLDVVGQGLEAVREQRRDLDGPAVLPGQFDFHVLQEGRRVGAQVDDLVEHRPSGAADQFRLERGRALPVHPADGASSWAPRHIALHHVGAEPRGGELIDAETAGKETTLVPVRGQIHQHRPIDVSRREMHGQATESFPSVITDYSI